ncbi:MAG TPA: phage minor head protein [Atribacterota bacterium]|nr:phage minor head protein [Atribacterota bacterium]
MFTKKDINRIYKIASYKRKQALKNYAEKAEQLTLNFGDLKMLFGLPPKEAIEYFKKKKPELTEKYYDLWKDAHDKSFTIAGIASLSLLTDIQGKLQQALKEGMTYKQFEEEFESSVLKKMGWTSDDEDIPPYRIENIFRTNIGGAYCAGRWQSIEDNKESRPYLMYHTMEDPQVRTPHADMDKKVFRVDDPIWDTHAAKNGYGCRCWMQALSERDIKRKGIKVEDSGGRIIEKEIVLNKAEDIRVKISVYIDPKGNHIPVDPGFDYNPGKKNYIPDPKNFPPALRPIAEKLIENIPEVKENINSVWENGVLIPERISKWQESNEDERKILLNEVLSKKLQEDLKTPLDLPNGYIYGENTKEFDKYYGRESNGYVPAYYSNSEGRIVFNLSVMEDNYRYIVPLHENTHVFNKKQFNRMGDTFYSEGSTDLFAMRKYVEYTGKEVYISDYGNMCSDSMIQLIKEFKGNKSEILNFLKNVILGKKEDIEKYREVVLKTKDIYHNYMTQQEYNEMLKDLIKTEEIDPVIKKAIKTYLKDFGKKEMLKKILTSEQIDKEVNYAKEKLNYSQEEQDALRRCYEDQNRNLKNYNKGDINHSDDLRKEVLEWWTKID